jgi:Protein of unknown function (DUF2750)
VTPEERYDHLVEQVSATGRIWLLEDEAGLVGSVDEEGQRYLAIWPDLESAHACAIGPWKEARPTSMDVRAALPAIVEREGMLAAHPTREDEGFLVSAADLELRLVD